MSAHYINVGQADSILLEFKTAAILIDAGGELRWDIDGQVLSQTTCSFSHDFTELKSYVVTLTVTTLDG